MGLIGGTDKRRPRGGRRGLRGSRPAGPRTPTGRRDVQRSFSPREPEPLRPRALARRRGAALGRSGSYQPADRVAFLRERNDLSPPIHPPRAGNPQLLPPPPPPLDPP